MSRREKLLERLRRTTVRARADDVALALEGSGWRLTGQSGSHVRWQHGTGGRPIVYPLVQGRWVKVVYVRQILKRLDDDDSESA